MKFSRKYNVRSSEITPQYKLKEYFVGMYFQECFAEYMDSKSLAAYHLTKLGLTWLTSDVAVQYCAPMPFWRDSVEMRVWMRSAAAVRIFVDFEAIAGSQIIAKGSSIQLIADAKTHRPQRVADFVSSFELEPQTAVGENPFEKIDEPTDDHEKFETSQVVRFDDLDFNMHLNNVKYVPRALESIPLEFRSTHRLAQYHIKFMCETFFNNTVISQAYRYSDTILHRLIRAEDGEELCKMKSLWLPNNL